MYTKIPVSWRTFDSNVTLQELNDVLVQLHIPTIVFIALLTFIGVFGNILVVYIYTTKYHASTHRCFILWLGWLDLVACAFGMPLLIVSMLYPYMFPSVVLCKVFRFVHVFLVVGSALVVVTIAFERHRRICSPFSLEMSTKKISLMCFVACILGFLSAIPAIFVYGDAHVDTGVNNITGIECYVDPELGDSKFPFLYYIYQLLITLISMFILGVFYFRIGRQIWWHHHFIRENAFSYRDSPDRNVKAVTKTSGYGSRINSNSALNNGVDVNDENKNHRGSRDQSPAKTSQTSMDDVKPKQDPYGDLMKKATNYRREYSQQSSVVGGSRSNLRGNDDIQRKPKKTEVVHLRTRQVTTMLFIITLVFVLSFIPHLILMVLISRMPEFLDNLSPVSVAVYNIFLRSFVINNMANPIIYGFCDKKFRAECKDLLMTAIYCGRR